MKNYKNVYHDIYLEVTSKLLEDNKPYLETRVAKRNFRTLEGLERAVNQGGDDVNQVYPNPEAEGVPLEDYRAALTDKVQRSVFYYLNEPLIYRIVRKFDNLPIPEEDRVSAATKGFVTAMNLFDPSRGFQFSTFAWRLMTNEIIAINKERIKQTIIRQAAREIVAEDDGVVIRIEKSTGHRIIKINKEEMKLYNVTLKLKNSSERTYHFLYHLTENIYVGGHVVRGEVMGTTAGVETEIGSVESYMESETRSDYIFHNPVDNKSESFRRAESVNSRKTIMEVFRSVIENELTDSEKKIVLERLLPVEKRKRTNLSDLAKELQISTADVRQLEKRNLNKIKDLLYQKGLHPDDLEVFE